MESVWQIQTNSDEKNIFGQQLFITFNKKVSDDKIFANLKPTYLFDMIDFI
jgi:hypothetical protein